MSHASQPDSIVHLNLSWLPIKSSVRMQTAYLGPEPDARRLTYDDDANNTRSKSRFESKDETTDGSFWSIRGGSTNASLSGRNQDAISPEFSLHESVSRYFLAEINTNWTDGLLIICAFVSGLVDGLSFNAWGSFSSMQSGLFPSLWQ